MNTKEIMASIVTAMVVVTMFASSAAAITVDGIASPGEWASGDKLVDDIEDGPYGCGLIFNISSMWAHYDSGMMYFRLDVVGTPPTGTLTNTQCYAIHIDYNTDGNFDFANDYSLFYDGGGSVALLRWTSEGPPGLTLWPGLDTGATVSADHGEIVEFMMPVDNVSGGKYIDENDFCILGWADDNGDGAGEDNSSIACQVNELPVAAFTFTGCESGTLDASGSYDTDGYITTYEWDLDDDGNYDDDTGEFVYSFAPGTGNFWIGLKVTDNYGGHGTLRKQITVAGNPTASITDPPSDIVVDHLGEYVTFSGSASDGTPPYTWTWDIGGTVHSGAGQPTSYTVFISSYTIATLTVVDANDCEGTDSVTVRTESPETPPSDVPILTPTGMVALIGMLCIVGAGRILTKGRRS